MTRRTEHPFPEKALRKELTKDLQESPCLDHRHPAFWHGRLFSNNDSNRPQKPVVVWQSDFSPRDDHDAPDWLKATEYTDTESTMNAKVAVLANLLRASRKTVVYSGAGISRAAGIGQAARGARKGGNKTTTAEPTFTHYAVAALAKEGLIHGWVQQNHDGLPQKAGFPQERINEVHGSWYDPTNPVVLYSGNLKTKECEWMTKDARTADLTLVMGTSLSGLNADQVATKPAARSCSGKSLGMVLINLQQTAHDGEASLRVFGKCDDVLRALLSKLSVPEPTLRPAVFQGERRVLVPYDANGNRSETMRTWLDLRPGAAVRLNPNHNIQGAKQPINMHIGARRAHRYRGELRRPGPGIGVVSRWNDRTVGIDLKIEGVHMLLGQWWVEAATEGRLDSIPIINVGSSLRYGKREENEMMDVDNE